MRHLIFTAVCIGVDEIDCSTNIISELVMIFASARGGKIIKAQMVAVIVPTGWGDLAERDGNNSEIYRFRRG